MPKKSVKPEIETKHKGNRSQSVRESNNVIQTDISGSKNIININPPSKPTSSKISVNASANFLTLLGRFFLKYLGIKKFNGAVIISIIGSGYLSFDMFALKLLPQNFLITFLGMIWLVLTLLILVLYFERTCKKCGERFALIEIDKRHLGSKKYRGEIHHNIKSAYKCDFCGNKVESDFVDVESTDRRV